MPRYRYICHEQGWFWEWSTIVDAPVTAKMTEADFRTYYLERYGQLHMPGLEDRLARARMKGTSSMLHDNLAELIGPWSE